VKTPKSFAAAIAQINLPSVFNPYSDCCPVHDLPEAALVRKRNLSLFLESAIDTRVDTIWVARDLGYRGGRRTGVPLTDEVHLEQASSLMGGVQFDRATQGPILAERTAATIWRVLSKIGEPVVLWNVFPLHPHERDDSFSNRCHTRFERDTTWPFLLALIAMIKPRQLVAIGRDAGTALTELQIPIHTVRHPSYGGQNEFISGIGQIYGDIKSQFEETSPELPLFEIEVPAAA
jgi:hypothetical protein